MSEKNGGEPSRIDRRSTLIALGAGAGAVAGIRSFSGTAAAWDRFDVCFRGCSEVWMIVADRDVGKTPPTPAQVIVEENGAAVCHEVEFTTENTTTIPGKFGDAPVLKYAPGGDEKILGVIEIDHGNGEPVWCVTVNGNNCADTPNTPDVHDAPCVPDDHPVCPAGDYCGGTGQGGEKGKEEKKDRKRKEGKEDEHHR
jgi:hypothetical protein